MLKGTILFEIAIPCNDKVEINQSVRISTLNMDLIFQRFWDQLHIFEKIWYTPQEFKEFFADIVKQTDSNGIKDETIKDIEHMVLPKLFKDGVFVNFYFQ